MLASKPHILATVAGYSMARTCLLLLVIIVNTADAAQALHPLAPPDTSSPRATLTTFLDDMNKAVTAYKAHQRAEARAHFFRAIRCLNLGEEPPAIKEVMGICNALYLKEILDRIPIPPFDQIPDAKAMESQKTSHWTLPETEITIAGVKEESGSDRFLFTPNTVKNAELYYQKVRLLPYKAGCEGAMYEQAVASAGLMVPKHVIAELPQWLKRQLFGQALWQWLGLALFFFVGIVLVFLLNRYGCKVLGLVDKKTGGNLRQSVGGLILPVALILFARIGLWFTVYVLHFLQADVYVPMAFVFLSISYLGTIWLTGALLNRAATVVIALGGFESGGMSAPLIRLAFDAVTVAIVAAMALTLGARLGLPTYSLVAGLGIGGLAVALAGQETLSNLIGTVMILLDKPFKLGDFVVLGEGGDLGTVAAIGLRSTRIRTRDGILVSIPNSKVANMRIVNESAPVTEARIHLPVGAAYGSQVEEVEEALLAACRQCEYVASDSPPSVRLVAFGDSALMFELLVWLIRPEFRGRATNHINKAICEEFRKRGIEMPFPQRDIHIRKDE